MRVVVTASFTTYYQGVVASYDAGTVLDGELAAYLLQGGSAVKPIDDQEADAATAPVLDISGTAAQILDWVGGDPGRAREAAAAEASRDKPRSTLLAELNKTASA